MPSRPAVPGPSPAPFVQCVTADNPSDMTLSGTNTYLIGAPGADTVVVVDPGPAFTAEEHVRNVLEAADGRRVELILATHRHEDHTGAIDVFHEATGAPVRAHLQEHCRGGGRPLQDGDRIVKADTVIEAIHTPGHTSDSFCFMVPSAGAEGAVLTGDTILGAGTTMLDHPDGTLADYLGSLQRLHELGDVTVLPAHGPVLPSVAAIAQEYTDHRRERVAQVRQALTELPEDEAAQATPEQLAERIYPGLDGKVRQVAALVMAATLDYVRATA